MKIIDPKQVKVHANSDELNLPFAREAVEALKIEEEIARRYCKEPPLLDELAAKHGLLKEHIFLEGGVEGVIKRVFDYRLRPGSSVLLPELGYPIYAKTAVKNEVCIETFQFDDLGKRFSYNMEDLLRKLKSKPDIVVLIDPESPLGFSIRNDELEDILKEANPDTLVMLDQAHEGIREKHVKDITRLVSDHPNVLLARSFSKFYGLAGERVGYALCGEKVQKMIRFEPRYLGFTGSAQQSAIAALRSEEHYKQNAALIREQKARFNDAIRKLDGYRVLETDGLSSLVQVPKEQSAFLRTQADAAKIAIRHLGDYNPEKLTDFYRVTMCPPDQMGMLIDLFESVAWLYDLDVVGADVIERTLATRDEGYTIHRVEYICPQSKVLMGHHKVIVPPGGHVSVHQHDDQDEIFVFRTRTIVELDGKRFEAGPDDSMQVKPGQHHYLEAPADRFARFMPLRFPYHPEKKQGASYDPTEKK